MSDQKNAADPAAIIRGSLVRWITAPGSPFGYVANIDPPRVKVKFDGDPEPKIFNLSAGAVERVQLTGTVRRLSTGSIGLIHAPTTALPPRWQVIMDGQIMTIAEADLRPHQVQDPHGRLINGQLGTARQFALAVTARRYEIEQLTNELVSLGEARVDIKPHQVSVVHRVVTNYPHRFLLCDEVGLGKTIEAGMILKELRARGSAERTLVIVPPNLVRQWQFELKSKFNETFSILNSETVRYLRNTQAVTDNPFLTFDSVLVSSAWVANPTWAALAAEVHWDMVIVDEAHHARVNQRGSRRETRLYRAVRALSSPDAFSKRAALFLTATPMQLDSGELYSLIELLDAALFPTEEHFNRHRAELPGLNRLVHELTEHGYPVPGEDSEAVVGRIAGWLDQDPDSIEKRLSEGPVAVTEVCQELSARHLLSEILIRNRKKIVGGFMPRQAHRWEVSLTPEEHDALGAVEDYVRQGYARAERTNDAAVGFVMVTFQKLMASSIRALRASLYGRRRRLEDRAASPVLSKKMRAGLGDLEEHLDDDEFVTDLLADVAAADAAEAADLKRLVELLDGVKRDSKADTLVEKLAELARLDPHAKVLLFTEFRETQEYLRERMAAIGWDVQLFHGQLKPEAKDAAVEAFRVGAGPSILLSTEAGGEGRNFQFCHLLVNYVLPWNPMRVEQRIGRIDRIGQSETVQVFNFWVKGTVEERVLDVLERRINVFEDTVGGLDPILGDTERDLTKILQLGGDERERALQRFEAQIERKIAEARAAEEKLRDFIMETKSYSREIASTLSGMEPPISAADQERFVKRLLRDVNTHLSEQADGTYELTFHEPFVGEFPELTKEGGRRRMAAFRSDLSRDSEHVEYFALGHPVVDSLIARATSGSYAGCASGFYVDDPALVTRAGWLVVYELGVPGLRERRELSPFFVIDDGGVSPGLGQSLLERLASFPNDEALSPADIPVETFDDALSQAESSAYDRLADLEIRAAAESERQLERERAKLEGYFDYRDHAARDRLESSRRILANLEASDQADSRRIIPVWRANVARDEQLIDQLVTERSERLAMLEHRASGGGDLRLVAAARVEIVGGEG